MMLGYNTDMSERRLLKETLFYHCSKTLTLELLVWFAGFGNYCIEVDPLFTVIACTLHNCCTWFDFIGVWWRLSAGACVMSGLLCVSDLVSKSLPERTLGVSGGLQQESHPQRFHRGHRSGISLSRHMLQNHDFKSARWSRMMTHLKCTIYTEMPAVQ